uniref:Uncharacterized protein n=1 Tax=viral metagenome TaxID=1070528 RepID=A0A6C0BVU5_9ZZZZ
MTPYFLGFSVKFCDHYGKASKKYWNFGEKTRLLKNGHL